MPQPVRLGKLPLILATLSLLGPPTLPIAANQAPKRRPEVSLSGISVHGTIQQAINKYGRPGQVANFDVENAPAGSGERDYLWTKGNTKMSVTTEYYVKDGKEIESNTETIEVVGEAPVGDVGKTGSGLSLGDTLEKAKRIYGADFRKSQIYKTHFRGDYFPVQALEWGEGSEKWTRLCLAFDKQGGISFIMLTLIEE